MVTHSVNKTDNDKVAKMHESLQQLATSLQSNQALHASALVGRTVLVDNDSLQLGVEDNVKIAVEILPGLSEVRASIYDESGELIQTISLGEPKPGFFQFHWNGFGFCNTRMKEGTYTVKVFAVYEGKEVTLSTMSYANVDSVSIGQNGEGLKLNVAGIGSVSLDQVRQISV